MRILIYARIATVPTITQGVMVGNYTYPFSQVPLK